jgi:serine/threonine protein kinase
MPTGADVTAQGTILGTLQYMSPEQLEGQEADARSDVFAFGTVLYEMLTGRKAFDGRSQSSLIAAIMHVDPPRISELNPTIPPQLPAWSKSVWPKIRTNAGSRRTIWRPSYSGSVREARIFLQPMQIQSPIQDDGAGLPVLRLPLAF